MLTGKQSPEGGSVPRVPAGHLEVPVHRLPSATSSAMVLSMFKPIVETITSSNSFKSTSCAILLSQSKLLGEEIEYNEDFRLYMTSRHPNPHFTPDIAAMTTIINFSINYEVL